MRPIHALSALGLALAALFWGCAQNVTVSVPYRLPPDVPVPVDPHLLSVGRFQVEGGPEWAGDYLANELQKRIDVRQQKAGPQPAASAPVTTEAQRQGADPTTCTAIWPATCQASTQPNVSPSPQELNRPAVITGKVRLQMQDIQPNRVVRRADRYHDIASQPAEASNRDTLRLEPLPMLIRRIDAIVEFTIQPQGQAPYIVETRHSYDSRFDPLSYGPMGLNRPDEPMNVPSVEEAIRQTLTICLDTFCDMIQPPQGRQDVQLLPLDEPGTGKVMALAAKGQYAQAAKALGKIKPFPDDLSYVFDLAVLQEAAGEKVAALENYRKVVVQRAAGFVQGRHGIARLTRSSP